MKKMPLVFLLFISHGLFAQLATEDFRITLPEKKIKNSLYNEITFLDSRPDTSNMGIVQLGTFNKKAEVIPKKHISLQIVDVLNALNDTSAKDGKLLFHLRHFNFAEITGGMNEKGYCYLHAELYTYTSGLYVRLGIIDTVLEVKALDVTNLLFKKASNIISGFISKIIPEKPMEGAWVNLIGEIKNLDRLEKLSIPLYITDAFAEGIYLSYASLADQKPEHQAIVKMNGKEIQSVRIKDKAGNPQPIKERNIYAVVYNGTPYVNTDYGYYPLHKRNGDFYFIGKAKATANGSEASTAALFFGILSVVMVNNTDTYEMKLDHNNGAFMRIRRMGNTARGGY